MFATNVKLSTWNNAKYKIQWLFATKSTNFAFFSKKNGFFSKFCLISMGFSKLNFAVSFFLEKKSHDAQILRTKLLTRVIFILGTKALLMHRYLTFIPPLEITKFEKINWRFALTVRLLLDTEGTLKGNGHHLIHFNFKKEFPLFRDTIMYAELISKNIT